MTKPAHYAGNYHVQSRRVRLAANTNPLTTCWRCGLTLGQHAPHKSGKPARWTAGHVDNGLPGGLLMAEASTCNFAAGAEHGNEMRQPMAVSQRW